MRRLSIKKPKEVRRKIKEYFTSSPDLRFAHKLNGILMLLEDIHTNCSAIARIYGSSPQTIAKWVHKLNQGEGANIEALRDQIKPGRNTRLSKNQLLIIKDVIIKSPSYYKINSSKWDGNTLSEYLTQQFGITLQIRQCQRILQRIGAANKRGRPIEEGS